MSPPRRPLHLEVKVRAGRVAPAADPPYTVPDVYVLPYVKVGHVEVREDSPPPGHTAR